MKAMVRENIDIVFLSTVARPVVSIILPTYNESKNVAELLRQITNTMENVGYEYECIFVDDSNDNTPEIIKVEAEKKLLVKRQNHFARMISVQ